MKNIEKKGFTLVELLGVVVILGIVSGLVVLAYVNVRAQMKVAYYKSVEESLLVSGGSYFSANKENQPTIFGDEKKVSVEELVTNKYTDREIADPDGKACNLENSYVGAYKNSYDKTNYYVCLECGDYKSDNIACNGGVNYTLGVRARKKNSKDSYKLDGKTWSSETVVLVFETLNDMETAVVEDETGAQKTCKLETKNKVKTCEIEIDKSGKYTYYAKTSESESKKGELTVLIDKTKPTFEIQEKGVNDVIEVEYNETEAKRNLKNKVYDIKDPDPESGIKSIEYSFEKDGAKDYYHGVGITDSFDVEKDLELGRYKLKVRVENNAGLKTEKTVTYVIYKKLAIPDSSTFCDNLTYNGSVQNLVKVNKEGYIYNNNMQTNAGSYEVTATLKENYRWSDNSTNARKFTCTIARLRTATTGSCNSLTYSGSSQTLASGGRFVTYSSNAGTNAGSYTVTITADSNHLFSDGASSKNLTCSIARARLSTTGSCKSLSYTGGSQTLASGGSYVTYSNNAGTNAQNYTVTVSSNANYAFSDGTTSKTLTCSIARARTATTGSCNLLSYTGYSQTLASGGSYVTYSNNSATAAGNHTVTVTANANYAFSDGTTSKTLTCSIKDSTPPTVNVTVTGNGSASGVNVSISCSDAGSGCKSSNPTGDTGLKSSKSYTICDNSNNCVTKTVTVTSSGQTRTCSTATWTKSSPDRGSCKSVSESKANQELLDTYVTCTDKQTKTTFGSWTRDGEDEVTCGTKKTSKSTAEANGGTVYYTCGTRGDACYCTKYTRTKKSTSTYNKTTYTRSGCSAWSAWSAASSCTAAANKRECQTVYSATVS